MSLMDLICTSCGEPWDLDYVLHEEPEAFEKKGSAIVSCPCCPEKKSKVTEKQRLRLDAARELGELLGDDVDGYAAELEDLQGYLEDCEVEEDTDREAVAYSNGLVVSAMKFSLGQIVITRGAQAVIPNEEVIAALKRHAAGEWGQLCEEDHQANEEALRVGNRLLSVYHSATRVKFYVITEHDRSVTTILLPEEY
jgi:hypothetical protein